MASTAPNGVTQSVLDQIQTDDARAASVMGSLVRHLHAFVREVEPTPEEWQAAIEFLVNTGKMCTPERNEFILISDMLGVTTLVNDLNQRGPATATPASVEGPFHSIAPARPLGALIAEGPEWERGERIVVCGQITDCAGRPLPGATLDVWQASDRGLYDSQEEAQQPGNLRGLFTADAEGRYWFRSVRPSSYPVPTDGTGGQLLRAMGRHPMRPAHIHVQVSVPGYQTLTTHIFVAGDPYLGSDAAFADKPALVAPLRACSDPLIAARYEMQGAFGLLEFDFRLAESTAGAGA